MKVFPFREIVSRQKMKIKLPRRMQQIAKSHLFGCSISSSRNSTSSAFYDLLCPQGMKKVKGFDAILLTLYDPVT